MIVKFNAPTYYPLFLLEDLSQGPAGIVHTSDFFSNKILHKAGKKDLVVLIGAMEGGNEVLRPLRFGTNYFGGKSDFHIHL